MEYPITSQPTLAQLTRPIQGFQQTPIQQTISKPAPVEYVTYSDPHKKTKWWVLAIWAVVFMLILGLIILAIF